MALVKLCALSAVLLPLFGCDPAHDTPPGPSDSTEKQSTLGSNLSFPWSRLRLPRYILPVHYNLLVHPDFTSLSFSGSVQIEIDVQNNTNWLVLHSKGLNITKATIFGHNLTPFSEQVTFLSTGHKYFLHLEFNAGLSEGFYGFYKSTYKTSAGETRVLASTHFEPTSARMAFPCFDEPSFKANFTVRIRRGPEFISLSNMPLVMNAAVFEDQFSPSVKMSTYLVAFVVCDFKSVTVSIYAAPEKWHQTHFALEVAVKMLDFYEEYFNIQYPLPKQDLIAIPDFQSGAMENWGLTTYRETSLLFDSLTSSVSDKVWVSMVIGHELAHQWFGNLVTMEWWNDIWLNEGFARYMEFISVEATYPEFKVEEYLLHTCFAAVGHDSLNSSRPISSAAENPTQIKEMFDTVSYDKGACVLHMIRHFLTDEVFQSGIVRYLRKYSYTNAKNQDLWDSLSNLHFICCCSDVLRERLHLWETLLQQPYLYAGEHIDLTAMMNTWILQKGIPVVTVRRNGPYLELRQDRFLKTILPSDPHWSSLFLWHIPVTYKTDASNVIYRHMMTTKTGVEVDWVKVNTDMTGYYVVHYEDGGWEKITKLLSQNHTALSYKDRTHLIHNAFQLVTAGLLPLNEALDLITYLRLERHTVPLLQGLGYLESFYRMIEKRNDHELTNKLGMHILHFFRAVIDQQTWSDSGSVSERRLRSEVLSLACHLKDPPCLEHAQQSFKDWIQSNGTQSPPTDVAETVYSIGAKGVDGWTSLFYTYTTSLSEAQKRQIMEALTSTEDTSKLQRLLELGLEGKDIKAQDLSSVIYMVARNPLGHHLAWSFVKKHWRTLVQKFQLGSFCIRNILIGTTSQFTTSEELADVQLFFESIKSESSQLRVTRLALDNVKKNVYWVKRNLGTLKKWLDEQIQ
uniref:Aminopeptidase n=1 Tax=Periophthalmus magnuspinnatus TaxID=409849 RepID=A0A3B4BEX6_9GOBI